MDEDEIPTLEQLNAQSVPTLEELNSIHQRPKELPYIDPRVREAFAESYQGKAAKQLEDYSKQRVQELSPKTQVDAPTLEQLNARLKSDVAQKGQEIGQSYWGPNAVINSQAPKPVEDNGLNAWQSGTASFSQNVADILAGIPKSMAISARESGVPDVPTGNVPNVYQWEKAADWAAKFVREESPTNPSQETANQIGGTAGALAAFWLGGAAGRTIKATEMAIPSVAKAVINQTAQHVPAAVMASAGTAASEYDRALKETGNPDIAYQAWEKNMFTGVPFLLSPTIKAFNVVTGGALKQFAGRFAQGGLTGMFQMATSHALTNLSAQETYDKTREIVDGVLQAGGSGFAINALLSGLLGSKAVAGNLRAYEYVRKAQQEVGDIGNTDYYKKPILFEVRNKMESLIESATVDLKPEYKAVIDKPITDAVQEPKTEGVDVREQTTNGQGMVSPHPEGEATQESQAQEKITQAKAEYDKAYEEFNADQSDENSVKLGEAHQNLEQAISANKPSRKNPYSDQIKELEKIDDEEEFLSRARYLIEQFPDKQRELTADLRNATGKDRTEGTRNKFIKGLQDAAGIPRKVVTNERVLLNEQFKNVERGVRQGRLDSKTDLRHLLGYVKDTIGKLKLSDKTHKSILNRVKNLNFLNHEKVKQVQDYIDKVVGDRKVAMQIESIEALQESVGNNYKHIFPKVQHDIISKLVKADVSAVTNFSEIHSALKALKANMEPVTSENYERVPDMEALRPIAEQAGRESQDASMRRRAERIADDLPMGISPEVMDWLGTDTSTEASLDAAKKAEARTALDQMTEPLTAELSNRPTEPLLGKIFDSFKNLSKDVMDKLPLDDLKKIVRKLDQMITNNDFSNSQELASKIEMARNSGRIDPFTRKATDRWFSTPSATMEHLYKQISEKMSRFYAHSGLGRLESGDKKAKETIHDFRLKAKKLMDDIQGRWISKFRLFSAENSAKSSVYSNLIQAREGMSSEENLASNKQDILNSIEGAKYAKDFETADAQQKALDELEGATDIEGVKRLMEAKNPEVKKWVDGLTEIVSQYYDIASANFEALFGGKLEKIGNYLPRKTAVLSGAEKFEQTGFTINPTEARSLLERNPIGARNYIKSKDFFPTIFENISQIITNYHVQPAAHDIKAFFDMDASNGYKWTGGKESHDILSDYFKQTVFGFGKARNWFPDFHVLDIASRHAIQTTLAGLGGKAKQYGPGAWRLLTQFLNRPGLVFGNGANTEWAKRLRDEFPISSRAKRLQGVFVGDVSQPSEKIANGIVDKLERGQELFGQKLLLGTREFARGDANIAERAWAASYLDYLSKNGIDVSDTSNEFWKNEYDLRNTTLRKEAQQAGETYVGVNMLPSTGRETTVLLNKMSKEAKMFFPFLTYQVSLGQRMQDRWHTILGSATSAEKASASKKLIGDIAEAVSFNYVFNQMIVQSVLDYGMEKYMAHYGLREDEEAKKERIRRREARGAYQTASSLIPLPGYQMFSGFAEEAFVGMANDALYQAREDQDQKYSEWKESHGIPDYKQDMKTVPLLDVLYKTFGDNWEIDGDDLVYTGQNGDEVRKPITPQQKELLENAWLTMTLTHLGLKDFADIMRRAERATVKEVKQQE